MDSLTDLQSSPQEQPETQSILPPNVPSPATVPEDTGIQPPPPPSDPQDVYAMVLKKKQNERLRALGKTFGDIPDVPIFTHWKNRIDCCNAAVHRSIMAGICGNSKDGAYSVALSDRYQDDEDGGDIIIYTGAGGREQWTNTFPPKRLQFGPHTLDQSWDKSVNKSLIISSHTGNPVRVIRSCKCGSQYAPLKGYRYDGLYKVAACWTAKGRNGKNICRCRLERLPDQPPIPLRPITIATSKKKRKERLISYPTPSPLPFSNSNGISDETEFDIQSNPSPAQLTGSTGGESVGLPNLPQQRAVSEASTRIDFNLGEVDHDMKVTEPMSPQPWVPSNPAALPRYRWDPQKNKLVKLPASRSIPGDLGATGGDEEDSDEEGHRVEDDVTLVPSEVGHTVNERMETEHFPDTGSSPRYGTPDEPPASGSSALENQ